MKSYTLSFFLVLFCSACRSSEPASIPQCEDGTVVQCENENKIQGIEQSASYKKRKLISIGGITEYDSDFKVGVGSSTESASQGKSQSLRLSFQNNKDGKKSLFNLEEGLGPSNICQYYNVELVKSTKDYIYLYTSCVVKEGRRPSRSHMDYLYLKKFNRILKGGGFSTNDLVTVDLNLSQTNGVYRNFVTSKNPKTSQSYRFKLLTNGSALTGVDCTYSWDGSEDCFGEILLPSGS